MLKKFSLTTFVVTALCWSSIVNAECRNPFYVGSEFKGINAIIVNFELADNNVIIGPIPSSQKPIREVPFLAVREAFKNENWIKIYDALDKNPPPKNDKILTLSFRLHTRMEILDGKEIASMNLALKTTSPTQTQYTSYPFVVPSSTTAELIERIETGTAALIFWMPAHIAHDNGKRANLAACFVDNYTLRDTPK